jgi:Zn-dependent protease
MYATLTSLLETISIIALPLVAAVVFHEIAHGYVAYLKGDQTAKTMGRLTVNPLAHIDPVGTIALPLGLLTFSFFMGTQPFLFGWAKPVPVDPRNFPRPRRDMALVAVAGPATNLILATASAMALNILYWAFPISSQAVESLNRGVPVDFGDAIVVPLIYMLTFSVQINVLLALINLIPIPPLDGGRIVAGLLPTRQAIAYAHLEPVGLPLILFLLLINPFGIINVMVLGPAQWLIDLLL